MRKVHLLWLTDLTGAGQSLNAKVLLADQVKKIVYD